MNERMFFPAVSREFDLQAAQQYLAANTKVQAAYIFGSVGRGTANPLSDIDIAVLLPLDFSEEALIECQLQLMSDFEQFTSRQIQIVILNRSPLLLSFQVVYEGTLFFEADRDQLIEFEVRTREDYFDFKPRLDRINQAMIDHIREEGLGHRKRHTTRALEAVERIHQGLKGASER